MDVLLWDAVVACPGKVLCSSIFLFVWSQPKVEFAVFPPSRSREREIRRPSTFDFYWVLTICQPSTVRYAHRYVKGKQSEKLLL